MQFDSFVKTIHIMPIKVVLSISFEEVEMLFNILGPLRSILILFCHCLFDLEASGSLNPYAPDAASITSSIKYHAEFTPSFSPDKFELPKAFFATAQSVRDTLIINWNSTYEYYERLNVKQAYYLSMEFLQVCHALVMCNFCNR